MWNFSGITKGREKTTDFFSLFVFIWHAAQYGMVLHLSTSLPQYFLPPRMQCFLPTAVPPLLSLDDLVNRKKYIQKAVFSIFEYLNIQNKAVYQIYNKGMINDLSFRVVHIGIGSRVQLIWFL